MSSTVGTWSPSDLILPAVESDLDYKFFLVKESGRIDGLDISFNAGDWLVYVKEHDVGNWYKTSSGAAVFSVSDARNFPDPGFYTKVRLDNVGRVIDAGYLSAEDLPKHKHDIDTISGDWETKVKNYVAEMFQNQSDASVQFTYDKKTKTLSAEVNVDDDTITRNEWGELVASGSGSGGSSASATNLTGKIKINQVEDLGNKLLAIDSAIQKNFIVCNAGSGLDAKYRDEGTYLSVKIDGTSLVLNADGELSVSQSVLLGGDPNGGDIACGSHTHTSSQITDFEEAVISLIKNNAKFDIKELPIDEETIVINSNGQLSCVAAGTRPHTHKMDDIVDLNQKIANVWASQQPLQDNEDFSNGAIDFTGQSIGYAVRTINEYIKDLNERLEKVEVKMSSIDVPEPNNIEYAKLNLTYSGERTVVDKDTRKDVTAGLGVVITTDMFYPASEGKMEVILDGNVVYTLAMSSATRLFSSSKFQMTSIKDSYYDNAMYRGTYESMTIKYIVDDIPEGYHELSFRHSYRSEIHTSPVCHFSTYTKTTPKISVINTVIPSNNSYVSGVPCYVGDGKITFTPKVTSGFASQFISHNVYQYSEDGGNSWVTPEISSISEGSIYFDPISVYIEKGSSGSKRILEKAFNVADEEVETSFSTPSLIWNLTDVEEYRVVHGRDFDDQTPSVMGTQTVEKYSPKDEVPQYEMVIQNNVGSLVRTDFTNLNGPDYSKLNTDTNGYVWCNFRFESPFMNNIHIDVLHEGNVKFTKNKNGTLDGLKLFVGQGSDENAPIVWVDGNSPYIGYGTANNGVDNKGLDLFKSDNVTRYVTFGQRPTFESGYLFVKVGVNSNIDLGALVSSVKESIDEWT